MKLQLEEIQMLGEIWLGTKKTQTTSKDTVNFTLFILL